MKIITWNCNMAFRNKAGLLLRHEPDLLVIPECEHPDKLLFAAGLPEPTDILWFGKNRHKGLGIFSYNGYQLAVADNHNESFQIIVPVTVTNKNTAFNLFAIWANNPGDKDGRYVEQVWKAVHYYEALMKATDTILVGDFNSNTIWDRKNRIGNHSSVVQFLAERGIFSTYHLHHRQTQGAEPHPTLYLYRHRDKPYHLDYCFASADLTSRLQSVEIGDYEGWSKYSDHVPVIVTFDESPGK